jgi:hypothetical protein
MPLHSCNDSGLQFTTQVPRITDQHMIGRRSNVHVKEHDLLDDTPGGLQFVGVILPILATMDQM